MKHHITLLMALLLPTFIFSHTKKALIFGVTGQDGTYLTEFLLKKNYEVHGIKRRSSLSNTNYLTPLLQNKEYKNNFVIHYGDLSNIESIVTLIRKIDPDEIYNLAAQSHVKISFDTPEYTADVNALGTLRILEAIVKTDKTQKIKFYQASSCEMFGKTQKIPQNELTPFQPKSPYGTSKLYAYWITKNYRESGIFACNGILFNHESPIRGKNFVTRKISRAVAKVHCGIKKVLYLGNLDVRRDWGYAKDYIEAMWLMLQQKTPDDYVIATGQTHSVREFVEVAFKEIGITIDWKGEGINEIGFDQVTGEILVKIDSKYFRPADIDESFGDATKARTTFQWKHRTTFQELIKIMIREDIRRLQ